MQSTGKIALLLSTVLTACAPEIASAPAAPDYPPQVNVIGWKQWCLPADQCRAGPLIEDWRGSQAALVRVNAEVNRYPYVNMPPGPWHPISEGGYGDCRAFVLEKLLRLMALGWPRENLRVAVARLDTGIDHAVLLVWNDGAWWVLDNLRREIRHPEALPYGNWYIEPRIGYVWSQPAEFRSQRNLVARYHRAGLATARDR